MARLFLLSLVVAASLLAPLEAQAQGFAIDLEARAGTANKTAHAEVAGPSAKPKERGILAVAAGDKITVRWTIRNADGQAAFKDVTVHLFAVAEPVTGQQATPKLDKKVAAECALSMDFKPKDAAKGDLSFTLDKPGSYLLRLETVGAAVGLTGHEYFAALDVVAK